MAGAVLVPFGLRTLGLSPLGLGLALSSAGVGGLAGALVSTRVGARFGVGRVVIATWAVQGVAFALIALSPDRIAGRLLFGAGELLFGLGLGLENANSMGYRQAVTPDRLQGRMNTTMRSLNRAMIVIGAPLGGFLGDALGYRPLLWVVAVGFVVVAGGLAASGYRHARLPAPTGPG